MTPTEGQDQDPLRHNQEEADPTGIRDLLRGLPDPGPMPEDLAARISARLTVEQTHREQAEPDLAARSDAVVDLAAERSRRRPGRTVGYLGVAAAGLLLTTVAVGQLGGTGMFGGAAGPDSAAQVSTRSDTASDAGGAEAGAPADAAGEAAGQNESAPGEDGAGAGSDPSDAREEALDGGGGSVDGDDGATDLASGGAVELLPPLGDVTVDGYRQTVLASVRDEGGVGASTTRPSLTPAEADSCWQVGADRQDWTSRHAAEAMLDGEPVVVLVGQDGEASGIAVLLPRACTTGAPVDAVDRVSWGS